MDIQDDELYQDLIEGNLTESADGAEALWEILFTLIALVVLAVMKTGAWIGRRFQK